MAPTDNATRPVPGVGASLGLVGVALRVIATQPHLRALFIAIAAYGISYGASVPFIAVWLTRSFGVSEFDVGLLITVRGIGGAIGVPLLGWLSDRFGWRRPGIFAAFGVTIVSSLALAVAPSYEVALIIAFFSGVSAVALALVLVEDILPRIPAARGPHALSISANERTAFNVGGSLGSALGAVAVGASGNLAAGFLISAIAAGAGVLALLAWPRLPDPVPASVRAASTAGAPPATMAIGIAPVSRWRWAALLAFLLAQLMIFASVWTRSIFVPLYVTDSLGQPPAAVGPVFFVETATVIVLSVFAGLVIARLGVRNAIIGNLLFLAAGAFVLPLTTAYWQVFLVAILFGAGQAMGGAAAVQYAAGLIPGRTGLTVSLYASTFQVAPIIAGLGFGALSTVAGLRGVFWSVVVLLLFGVLAILLADHLRHRADR